MTGDRNGRKLGRSFVHFSSNLNVVVDAVDVATLRALKFVTHAGFTLSRITGTIGNRENLICLSIIRTPNASPNAQRRSTHSHTVASLQWLNEKVKHIHMGRVEGLLWLT